jgi:hypothetical protein
LPLRASPMMPISTMTSVSGSAAGRAIEGARGYPLGVLRRGVFG